jgi:hypothetical protein
MEGACVGCAAEHPSETSSPSESSCPGPQGCWALPGYWGRQGRLDRSFFNANLVLAVRAQAYHVLAKGPLF